MRKTSGLDISDRIKLRFYGDDFSNDALIQFKDYVKEETLAVEYEIDSTVDAEVSDINGHKVKISIEKN